MIDLEAAVSPPTVTVDFNGIDRDGTIPSRLLDVTGLLPRVGGRVVIRDDDGNSCLGFVAAIAPGGVLWLRPRWESWAPASATLAESLQLVSPDGWTDDSPKSLSSQALVAGSTA
jgi:hypothetical protein